MKKDHKTHKRGYSEKYDCMYCETCNVWLESNCGHPACEFCKNRPETPFFEKTDQRRSEENEVKEPVLHKGKGAMSQLTLENVNNIVDKIFGDMELVKVMDIGAGRFVVWTDLDDLEEAMKLPNHHVFVNDPATARVKIHELYDKYVARHSS